MLTILLAAALSGMWDDETFLGRGPALGAGLSASAGRHAALEVEGGWALQRRDAGYLQANGRAFTALARIVAKTGGPSSGAKAFVSAGAGVVQSSGTFTMPGQPFAGSTTSRPWTITRPMWEVGAGMELGASHRVSFRPELRWSSSIAGTAQRRSIEPPLWTIRGGLTVAIKR